MTCRLNDFGEEVLDPTPVTRAIGFTRPVSTLDEMRQMYRIVQDEAERMQMESPEEFYDFDIDEDPVPEAPFAHNLDNIPQSFVLQPPTVAPGGTGEKSPASPSGDNSDDGAAAQPSA